jgi:diguanylate cyclase (GGDEF)-like protein/PAS domain S-box-containing protein
MGFTLTQYSDKRKLLGSSEIARALINCTASGIYMVQEGKFIYISPTFTELTGYKETDLLGKKSLNLVYPDDKEEVRNNAIACLKGTRTTPYEYRFVSKDGRILWILEKVASATIREKKAAVGSFLDISEYKVLEQSLAESKEFSSNLTDNSPIPIMVAAEDTSIKYVNQALTDLTGFSGEELMGKKVPYPYWPEESEHRAALKKAVTGNIYRKEFWFRKKDGEKFWVEITASIRGNPPYFLSSWVDITQRKKVQEELRLRARLLDEASESIIVHDLNGGIVYANEAACKIRGYCMEELSNFKSQDLIAPRQKWVLTTQIPMLLEKGKLVFEADNVCKDGTVIPMETHSQVINYDGTKMIIDISHDVIDRKKTEQELIYLATHDALTGLPNRGLLNDRVDIAIAQAARNHKKVILMMLDLDHFKNINDEFGHGSGDQLLKVVGDRLKRILRTSDTVARFGGDEFFIVLPDVKSTDDATKVAEKIIKIFKKPFLLESHKLHITTSIGIAVYPDNGDTVDKLTRVADQSMYAAKDKGRDTYAFNVQYGLKM